MNDLMLACNQWAKRPKDERFWTLNGLYDATLALHSRCVTSTVIPESLDVIFNDQEPCLRGSAGNVARFSYPGFGQFCSLVGAPADYMRRLGESDTALVSQCLSVGLRDRTEKGRKLSLLLHRNGGLMVHAITSPEYVRIWDDEIVNRLLNLPELGWRVPPARPPAQWDGETRPATADDVLSGSGGGGLSINVGDIIAPAGLYYGMGDPNLFVFMVREADSIEAGPRVLSRFLVITHDITGRGCFKGTFGYYDHVCGNHILWGGQVAFEVAIRHLGNQVGRRIDRALVEVETKTHSLRDGLAEDQEKVKKARLYLLGQAKDDVLDLLFGKLKVAPKRDLEAAYLVAEKNRDAYGPPNTAWAMASGLAEVSQGSPFIEQRHKLDVAAGKILEMAF